MGKLIKKWKTSESGMKIREKLYPRFDPNPVTSPRKILAASMKRYGECDNKKNTSQINQEIELCKKFWKCFPYHYYMYDLYREDNQATKEDLVNYIPDFFWYYLYLPHYTSYKFSLLTDNKIVTEQFFRSLKILQPVTLCRIFQGKIYSPEMLLINFDQVCQELSRKKCKKIFVKPAESGKGKGIYIFHKKDDGTYTNSENIFFSGSFLERIGKDKDYIIQQGIHQHPEISDIYPESINTIRIITEYTNDDVHVPCAMMRLGRGKNEIDNASAGGIFLKIETGNGKLGDYAMSYDGEKIFCHPDTQFVFQHFQIPLWDEILRFATESARKLPFFTHLAWDIALTDKGPLAIEVNLSPGITGLQISSGGLREVFGIEDPEYYWKNPGKRIEHN